MFEISVLFLIITVLIILNGLYVAAEFSIISISQVQLKQQAKEGNSMADRYLQIVTNSANQDRFIAVAQMGITLASLGLGMYGEHTLAGWLAPYLHSWADMQEAAAHTTATILALLFLTFWHIVAGEMIPKSLALNYPMATATLMWWPMRVSALVLAPLGWILNGIGNTLIRMLGFPVSKDETPVYSPDEMRMVFDESREGGLLPVEQHRLLERVIDFGERPLRLIMVPRTQVVGFNGSSTVAQALDILKIEEYSRYPVFEGDKDNITGVVHVKDLFSALRKGEFERPVRDLQHRIPNFPESMLLDEAMDVLRKESAHFAVVVEARGGTAGIVTVEDLVEELFGEILDEFDQSEVGKFIRIRNRWKVNGQASLEDFRETTGWELTVNPGIDSVAGLILDLTGGVPKPGVSIDYQGLRFTVDKIDQKTVDWCIVLQLKEDQTSQ